MSIFECQKKPLNSDRNPGHKKEGYPKRRFLGVIGCVDGSHISIQAPNAHENDFVNKKRRAQLLLRFNSHTGSR